MEHVLQTLRPLEDELGVEQIIKALNLNQGGCTANQCRETIYDLINKSEDDVTGKIFSIICGMVEKLRPDMKKFVFHLAWAPEKLDAENVSDSSLVGELGHHSSDPLQQPAASQLRPALGYDVDRLDARVDGNRTK
ncbi:hypothetical protein AVEN_70058-1 [Araneus ventricosus]|uniref:Uncharacterized protein n=1 Tax=Araneus ventricosus TaxID=182803 RepID=A0A4Y2TL05_ARAVE|nr:hypothetical protein AVEN_70058-1 [Araneus ventricosus]